MTTRPGFHIPLQAQKLICVLECVGLMWTPKGHWHATMRLGSGVCWKCGSLIRFNHQHNWEGLCDHLERKKIFSLIYFKEKENLLHVDMSISRRGRKYSPWVLLTFESKFEICEFEIWCDNLLTIRYVDETILKLIHLLDMFVELEVRTLGPHTL